MKMLSTNSRILYNRLPEVEVADRILTRVGRERILRDLLSVIDRNNLSDRFGLRLLHRHNAIDDGEIMLASESLDEKGLKLETIAVAMETSRGNLPNCWQVVDGVLEPIEFSHPAMLQSVDELTPSDMAGLEELAARIEELGVSDLIGIGVNYSDGINSSIMEGSLLVEVTDEIRRANIVRIMSDWRNADFKIVETMWTVPPSFDGNEQITAGCKQTCAVAPEGGHLGTQTHVPTIGQTLTAGCVQTCSVSPEGGHLGTTTHVQGEEKSPDFTTGCRQVCSVAPEGGHLGTTTHV